MKVPTLIAKMVRQEGGQLKGTDDGGQWWQSEFLRGEWSKQEDGSWKIDLFKPETKP